MAITVFPRRARSERSRVSRESGAVQAAPAELSVKLCGRRWQTFVAGEISGVCLRAARVTARRGRKA